ncbi:hypothetical protein HYALB_00013599 [Hymenoscyphus albidus]|uniref:Uncharacterized protein n=1 Tax=Hymenoscyphus albidus TaxID=595503 RepID=A0A9N9LJA0_9HELO|nr:hypothetical protein HYALB_00002809 [Hymenoscyphus albidus]CAG8980069.1 hypothetical protein HYALB_00013599 [Hymenoscyphus albidus]
MSDQARQEQFRQQTERLEEWLGHEVWDMKNPYLSNTLLLSFVDATKNNRMSNLISLEDMALAAVP